MTKLNPDALDEKALRQMIARLQDIYDDIADDPEWSPSAADDLLEIRNFLGELAAQPEQAAPVEVAELINALLHIAKRVDMMDCENIQIAADKLKAQSATIAQQAGEIERLTKHRDDWRENAMMQKERHQQASLRQTAAKERADKAVAALVLAHGLLKESFDKGHISLTDQGALKWAKIVAALPPESADRDAAPEGPRTDTDPLDKPTCGCPQEEFVYKGFTIQVHAEPGKPFNACIYDTDAVHDLKATTLEAAKAEACALIDGRADRAEDSASAEVVKQVERLREWGNRVYKGGVIDIGHHAPIGLNMLDAADLIERLQARVKADDQDYARLEEKATALQAQLASAVAAETEACVNLAKMVAREIDDTNGTATYIVKLLHQRIPSDTLKRQQAEREVVKAAENFGFFPNDDGAKANLLDKVDALARLDAPQPAQESKDG